MVTQSANFYAMGFVMWFIGCGMGAILAVFLRDRYYDKLFCVQDRMMQAAIRSEWNRANVAEARVTELEAQLNDLHFDGRP